MTLYRGDSALPTFIVDNLPRTVNNRLNWLKQTAPAFALSSKEVSLLYTSKEDYNLIERARTVSPDLVDYYADLSSVLSMDTYRLSYTLIMSGLSLAGSNVMAVIRSDANPEHVDMLIRRVNFAYAHRRMLWIANFMCEELLRQARTTAQLYKAWPELCDLLKHADERNRWDCRNRVPLGAKLQEGAGATRARGLPGWTENHAKAQQWVTRKLIEATMLGKPTDDEEEFLFTVNREPQEKFIIGENDISW